MRKAQPSLLCILAIAGFLLGSQDLAHSSDRFIARSWQSDDGLPSNVLRALAQSADSYLWIATAEGLVRFDGQRFTTIQAGPETAGTMRMLRSIFPLPNGEVWVTTSSNPLLRVRGTEVKQFMLPGLGDTAPTRLPTQVIADESGAACIIRGTELRKITDETLVPANRSPELDRRIQMDAVQEPERGRATQGQSPIRLRGSGGELWEFTPGKGLTVTDSEDVPMPITIVGESPSIIRTMIQDREGNLWVGTETQGLWRLRRPRVEVLTQEDGLSDRGTFLVIEDQTRALWAAPISGGLDWFSGGSAKHYDVQPSPTQRPVSALLATRSGALWAAARDGQVYAFKDGSFTPAFTAERGPGKVLAMAEDEAGQIWLGSRYGLMASDGGETRRTIDLGTPETVTSLRCIGSRVWAGTESGRLYIGEGETFSTVGDADAFGRQAISSILPDGQGGMWVGTLGSGLFQVRDETVQALAPRMPKVDPRITCVLEDDAGNLWMGTLGGICRVSKSKLQDQQSPENAGAIVLDRADGLLTRECTRGGEPAGWRGHDGTLYFSTGHGIARINPGRLSINTVPPPVVIEESSDGQQVLPQGTAHLQAGPGRSRLTFRFTALSFTSPEKVRFRTRLEGLDDTWRDTGTQREATYEAVPPGDYRFHVIAENGDGVWNEIGAALAVEVIPHIWETRWFRVTMALFAAAMAAGIGVLITRARLRARLLALEAQTSREKERARIAQDLHDDLGASLTEISLLANLAAEERKDTSDPDDTLPEVASKAQALVGALDEIVWAVNPRHDTLRSLAEYLAAFGGKFLGRAGITLRRDMPRDLPEVALDTERRHNIFLTTREALNNAVKHSQATEAWLRIRCDEDELVVSIEDNGHGFSTEADDLCEGLRGMRRRMEQIGGTCKIETSPGGTTVRLSLPLRSGPA